VSVGLYSGVSGLALGTGLYKNVSGLWGGAAGLIDGFGGGSPFGGASLYLNFLAGAPLDSRITFSRGSNATLVDSTGKITYAPSNLLLNSVFGGAVSGTPGTAPTSWPFGFSDGTLTVTDLGRGFASNSLRFAATANREWIQQNVTLPATGTVIVSVSVDVFVPEVLNQLLGFNPRPAGATTQYVYDGVVRSASFVPPTGAALLQAIITTTGTGGSLGVRLGVGTSSAATADVSFQDIQVEQVTYQTTAGTYNPTTTAAYYGPRFDYDPVTLAPKGLLIEEARTNLAVQSENFSVSWSSSFLTVTTNTTVAPDGTTTADTLTPNTTSGVVSQGLSFTGDGTKSVSVFLKAGTSGTTLFFLRDTTTSSTRGSATITWTAGVPSAVATSGGTIEAVEDYGNGWYRIKLILAGVIAANSNSLRIQADSVSGTGTVIVWGAQAENGAFATSYIPTVASQVTRSADVATMTGTNFSSWYNQTQGTFVAGYDSAASAFGILGNNSSGYLLGASARDVKTFNGTTSVTSANTLAVGAIGNGALSYDSTGRSVDLNGGTVATAAGVLQTINTLYIGYDAAFSANYLNGHIRQIAYFNTRLSDAQLQTLTAPPLVTTLSLDFTNGIYDA
jgi:hypothetical protein